MEYIPHDLNFHYSLGILLHGHHHHHRWGAIGCSGASCRSCRSNGRCFLYKITLSRDTIHSNLQLVTSPYNNSLKTEGKGYKRKRLCEATVTFGNFMARCTLSPAVTRDLRREPGGYHPQKKTRLTITATPDGRTSRVSLDQSHSHRNHEYSAQDSHEAYQHTVQSILGHTYLPTYSRIESSESSLLKKHCCPSCFSIALLANIASPSKEFHLAGDFSSNIGNRDGIPSVPMPSDNGPHFLW